MVLQQRGQQQQNVGVPQQPGQRPAMPQQQMVQPQQPGGQGQQMMTPNVSQSSSPLLAQQLQQPGAVQQQPQRPPGIPGPAQSQLQKVQQQQQTAKGEGAEGSVEAGNNDLSEFNAMPDEDLLGMGDDFNILEFADALDGEGGEGGSKANILDDLHPDEEAAVTEEGEKKSEATASVTNPPAAPPPYTVASGTQGVPIRGPPPPYPGPGQPKQVF